MAVHTALNRFAELLEIGLTYLRSVGIPWQELDERELAAQYAVMRRALADRPLESLADLPSSSSPEVLAISEVCVTMLPGAFNASPQLFALVVMHLAVLSIEHGACEFSCFAYALLSFVLGPYFGEHDLGLAFGKLGMQLAERSDNRFVAGACVTGAIVVALRTQGPRAGMPWLVRGAELADRYGDLGYAVLSREYQAMSLLAGGAPLEEAARAADQALDFCRRHRVQRVVIRVHWMCGLIRGLREPEHELGSLSNGQFDDVAYDAGLAETVERYLYSLRRLQARYWAGDFAEARATARRGRPLGHTLSQGFPHETEFWFYGALAELSCADRATQEEAIERTANDARDLNAWAVRCPATFANKAALIDAERARLMGQDADAERGFELSAELARRQRLPHEEGLAHELAARFYRARGIESVARAKLVQARSCYAQWGAFAKVARIDAELCSQDEPLQPLGEFIGALDVKRVISALHAVSSSLDLDHLVEGLMKTALQHGAANRGLLVLLAGEPRIRARATSDVARIEVIPDDVPTTPDALPLSILRFVLRSGETIESREGAVPSPFDSDSYFEQRRVRSLICAPILVSARPIGALYLENTLTSRAHSARDLKLLELIASQAAVSLENARLYRGLHQAQQRMARAEQVSRTGSFSWRPDTQELDFSDELMRIYQLNARPSVALLRERTHPEDQALLERLLHDFGSYDGQPLDLRLVMPDGALKHVAIIGSRLGRFEYTGMIRDVTEAKQAEESLQRTQAALTDMARVASLAELSAAIAHEVRQPVAGIELNISICLRRLSDDRSDVPGARAAAQRIQRDASRATAILERLRALFSKAESVKVAVDLNDAVSEVAELLRSRVRAAGATLTLDLQRDLPCALGDRVQLQQVVINLLGNALDATRDQARPRTVTLRTKSVEKSRLQCEVEDSGAGIGDADRTHIFEPFYSTKRRGMGMGLSICKNILVAHGGEISAHNNEPPPGATFKFVLPAC
jgi:C4-dicarboxylate-specific signal transduction histidine kinase